MNFAIIKNQKPKDSLCGDSPLDGYCPMGDIWFNLSYFIGAVESVARDEDEAKDNEVAQVVEAVQEMSKHYAFPALLAVYSWMEGPGQKLLDQLFAQHTKHWVQS